MKFCPECKSRLSPVPLGDKLVFSCVCGNQYDARPEDTLRKQEIINTVDSSQKYDILIENSSFDPAANVVKKECTQCGLPYMNRIYVGTHLALVYTCECGNRVY